MESHGAFNASDLSFLTTLGERLTGTSAERLSVIVQRFNSVLIHERVVSVDEEPDI